MGYTDQKIVGDIIATVNADDRENIKELFCECYCKFNEEFLAMFKDPDEAFAEMERHRCNYCPLKKFERSETHEQKTNRSQFNH